MLVKKGFQKPFQKKVPRQTQTGSYSQARRLPGSPPRVRGFLNKNQQSEQETTTVTHFWVHFWILFLESIISESISRKIVHFWILLFELASIAHVSKTKCSKTCDVKGTLLVIWHALGKARRILRNRRRIIRDLSWMMFFFELLCHRSNRCPCLFLVFYIGMLRHPMPILISRCRLFLRNWNWWLHSV